MDKNGLLILIFWGVFILVPMFHNDSFWSLVFGTYVIFNEQISKNKENNEGNDSNESVSQN